MPGETLTMEQFQQRYGAKQPIGETLSADDFAKRYSPPESMAEKARNSPVAEGTTNVIKAGADLVRGAAEALNPFPILKELDSLNPFRPGFSPSAAASKAKELVVDPILAQHATAAQEFATGRPKFNVAPYLRTTLGSLPLVGPGAMSALDRVVTPGETWRGIGNVVGMAAPVIKQRLGSAPKVPTPSVELLKGERTGSAWRQRAERIIEQSIPGAGPMQAFRRKQQTQLAAVGDELVQRISDFDGTPEQLGIFVQQELANAKQALKTKTDALYSQIDSETLHQNTLTPVQQVVPSAAGLVTPSGHAATITRTTMKKTPIGGVLPETRELKKVAVPLLRRIKAQKELLPPEELANVEAQLTRIINAPDVLPFRVFQDTRSDLIRITKRFDDAIPGKRAGISKLLAAATDNAIETALRNAGRKDLLDKWREVNALWKEDAIGTFNESVVGDLLKKAPEKAAGIITSTATSLDDVRRLKTTLPKPAFDAVAAQVVRDMLNSATEGEVPSGGMHAVAERLFPGMPPRQAEPLLSGKKLQNSIEKLSAVGKLQEILPPDTLDALNALADVASRTRSSAGGIIGAMITNMAMVAPLAAGMRNPATLFDLQGPVMQGAEVYAAVNVISRMMTHPEAARAFKNYLNATAANDLPQVHFWSARLAEATRELGKPQPQTKKEQPKPAFPVVP